MAFRILHFGVMRKLINVVHIICKLNFKRKETTGKRVKKLEPRRVELSVPLRQPLGQGHVALSESESIEDGSSSFWKDL